MYLYKISSEKISLKFPKTIGSRLLESDTDRQTEKLLNGHVQTGAHFDRSLICEFVYSFSV